MFTIRQAEISDLDALLELYCHHLVKSPPAMPLDHDAAVNTLQYIVQDTNYNILVGEEDGNIVSSVTLVIIKNLTHNSRPYAIIENVVTHAGFRGKGFAFSLMERACKLATEAGCYKVMLMTGSKEDGTLAFYERCGFSRHDKTGFIKWL